MIYVGKAPYRISLLGGGSDLDWFVKQNGYGIILGCAINKYTCVVASQRPDTTGRRGVLNYSAREEYIDVQSISHPLIRATLLRMGISKPLELASFGEAACGSGLGGSSSFLLALISALSKMQNNEMTAENLALLACQIELEDLNNPIGRQDQYLSALGGVQALHFEKNGEVRPLEISPFKSKVKSFCEQLVLVPTNIARSASQILSDIRSEPEVTSIALLEIRKIAEAFNNKYLIGHEVAEDFVEALELSVLSSWEIKKTLPGVMSNSLYELEKSLRNDGLKVLKLLGAGGGGYFLCRLMDQDIQMRGINATNMESHKVKVCDCGCQVWCI